MNGAEHEPFLKLYNLFANGDLNSRANVARFTVYFTSSFCIDVILSSRITILTYLLVIDSWSAMASWLKVAEDLLEVVDRRAKLVASELSDEQSDFQASASSEREVKARKLKSKAKGQPLKTVSGFGKNVEAVHVQTSQAEFNLKVDRFDDLRNECALEVAADQTVEGLLKVPSDVSNDVVISNVASLGLHETDKVKTDIGEGKEVPTTKNSVIGEGKEVPTTNNSVEMTNSKINDSVPVANLEDVPVSTSSLLKDSNPEKLNGNHPADAILKGSAILADTCSAINDVSRERETSQQLDISDGHEVPLNTNIQATNKTDSSPMKVQDQIEEAQGLLKTAVSTGHSKEARLAKVCTGLSSRLQEYKSENAQLEELLVAERELCSSYEARIKVLQQDLCSGKAEVARAESHMAEALAAKNAEIQSFVGTVDALKKQAATSEEKFASLQANMDSLMRSRDLTESRMIQALREELETVECRAEEERVAHNATKMAAMEREVELEHRAVEASNALARIQRTADESISRATELEHKVSLLESECASLIQELQEMEAHNRRGQKKASEESSQILQLQAWKEEVDRARQCLREAENKVSSLEAELQKMRVEMAGMKREADHYSRQEHMELEKRYRELTDLLYHKQTQLEVIASQKAAAEFQLEKEIKRLQEAQVEAERSRASRRSSTFWEEDTDIKALEPLPLHHRHMAAASMQLQRAAKLLDSGAIKATRFLWRYPVARISLLFYLVFVHLFLMHLLHRLQAQAEDFSSREAATALGIGNSIFP